MKINDSFWVMERMRSFATENKELVALGNAYKIICRLESFNILCNIIVLIDYLKPKEDQELEACHNLALSKEMLC